MNLLYVPVFKDGKKEDDFLTFNEVNIELDGELYALQMGDVVTIEPGTVHEFISKSGAVIEELSTTHFGSDSHYVDETINNNLLRKTYCRLRQD